MLVCPWKPPAADSVGVLAFYLCYFLARSVFSHFQQSNYYEQNYVSHAAFINAWLCSRYCICTRLLVNVIVQLYIPCHCHTVLQNANLRKYNSRKISALSSGVPSLTLPSSQSGWAGRYSAGLVSCRSVFNP